MNTKREEDRRQSAPAEQEPMPELEGNSGCTMALALFLAFALVFAAAALWLLGEE